MKSTVKHMMMEMAHGLEGKPSSLAMIPTYMKVDTDVPRGKAVAVLDAGGTNLRVARISFSSAGEALIEDFSKHPMPGTRNGEVGREEFFHSLAALTVPLADRVDRIGFCFSYPTEIFPDKDGRLIHWSKEVRAPEVEGCMVGSGLRDAMREGGISHPPEVLVLNDTAATLLAGRVSSNREWGGYVGFILGTGTNTSYVELNSAIGKTTGLDPGGSQIINCETGNYAALHRGKVDEMLDETTDKPQTYWLEKMVSGAYFGPLITQTIILAGQHGILSEALAQTARDGISTRDADNYCHNPHASSHLSDAVKSCGCESDGRRLWYLIDAMLERAARMTAANLAASVLKGRTGSHPLSPACLTIDGTTYYRYYRFQSRVECALKPFLANQDVYYEMERVNDAPLIGAAVAALTN